MFDNKLELICTIAVAVCAILGIVLSYLTLRRANYIAAHEFLTSLESPDFIAIRKRVINLNQPITVDNEDAAAIVNFFQHWGLMAEKKYLPMWVFDSGSGAGTIRMYDCTKDYIQLMRRTQEDDTYADKFEQLYNAIRARKAR